MSKIYPGTKIGKNAQIGDFVVIGFPTQNNTKRARETIIGDNALIRSHTVIYAGNKIGKNFQTGQGVSIREDNEFGDDVSVGTHSTVEHHVKIGSRVRVHSNTFIPEFTVLEDDSWIGPGVTFTNTLHPLCPKAKQCLKGPTIKRGAKIGGGAVLLPDIVIGEMALVGAGAVVVEDVPPKKIVVGNPARVLKNVSEINCPYKLIKKPY